MKIWVAKDLWRSLPALPAHSRVLGAVRAGCPPEEQQLPARHGNKTGRGRGFRSKGKHSSNFSKASTVMIAGFIRESRCPDKPVVTRQVQS